MTFKLIFENFNYKKNATFGHGVIWTIFERGLGIHKVMGVTWWGWGNF
jgi:hypothetical protein